MANTQMHDPILTPLGEQQCQRLAATFPHHSTVALLVSSPLRRTLQTTVLSFGREIRSGMRVIALPEAQEVGATPCDTGSSPDALEQEFGPGSPSAGVIDLGLVSPGWNSKLGRWGAQAETVRARARLVRQWLRARAEAEVVLVTHGGFLHFLTEDWSDSDRFAGTGWANAEFRSYEFRLDADDDDAPMVETPASRELRGGQERPLSETERLESEQAGKEG